MKRFEYFGKGTELYNENNGTVYKVVGKHSPDVYEVISTDIYDEEKQDYDWGKAEEGYLTSSEIAKMLDCQTAVFND